MWTMLTFPTMQPTLKLLQKRIQIKRYNINMFSLLVRLLYVTYTDEPTYTRLRNYNHPMERL